MHKNIYRPLSIPFLLGLILLNIIICGIIFVIVTGFVENNWFFITIGLLGTIILTLEDIGLFTTKIEFKQDVLTYKSGNAWNIFQKCINIKYNDIEDASLIFTPTPFIIIKKYNNKTPINIYIKQYSKKQVFEILKIIKLKIK